MHYQFGHSAATADTWYGQLASTPEYILNEQRECSALRCIVPDIEKVVESAVEVEVADNISSVGESDTSEPQSKRAKVVPSIDASSHTFTTNVQSEQLLQLLKRFYNDENAAFHSNEQHATASNDIVATCILPTRCGKSLLFFFIRIRT